MEYVRLYTTVHDDPKLRRLSDKAFRYYINALSWTGKHDREGVFEMVGKAPRCVEELETAGFFTKVGEFEYQIHGWDKRQVSAEKRKAAARTAADARWAKERTLDASESHEATHDESHMRTHTTPTSEIMPSRGEKSRGEKKDLAPRDSDALFEAVAAVSNTSIEDLTPSGRGPINKAVAMLRGVGATPAEVKRRARNWPFEVVLTAPGLAKHWASLDTMPKIKRGKSSSNLTALADQLEGR